jgi:phage-related protein
MYNSRNESRGQDPFEWLTVVVKYDNIEVLMTRATRPISWVSAALKEFGKLPEGAQVICLAALTIAAEGGKADIAKPMKGLGSGVFEIALPYRNAFEWFTRCSSGGSRVVHAFQKKSTQGIKTPQREIVAIRDRLKRLKEMLR